MTQSISKILILISIISLSTTIAFAARGDGPAEGQNGQQGQAVKLGKSMAQGEALKEFTINITEMARSGAYDHYMTRPEYEIRMQSSIERVVRGNLLMDGDRGAGKTALVETTARNMPADFHIFMLRLSNVIANANVQGQFEGRLESLMNDLKSYNGKAILFIDEAHIIFMNEQFKTFAQDLKNSLSRGELRVWAATTGKEAQMMDGDPAFQDRFERITVEVPTTAELETFARMLKARMQEKHGWRITDSAIERAVDISLRFLTEQSPARATEDLLDRTVARLRAEANMEPRGARMLSAKITQLSARLASLIADLSFLPEGDPERTEIESRKTLIQQELDEKKELRERLREPVAIEQELFEAREKMREATKFGNFDEVSKIKYEVLPEIEKRFEDVREQLPPDRITNISGKDGIIRPIDIATTVYEDRGYSIDSLLGNKSTALLEFSQNAGRELIGQERMLESVQRGLELHSSGLQTNKKAPFSTLVDGNGVELSQAMAKHILGDASRVVELDLSQYTERHTISRLIGAPPGYVGAGESGLLVDLVRGKGEIVFLIKNFDKGHPEVRQFFEKILVDGQMVDNSLRLVDFRHTHIVAETRLGLQQMGNSEAVRQKLNSVIGKEIVDNFKVVTSSKSIDLSESVRLVENQLKEIRERVQERNKVKVEFSESVAKRIAELTIDPNTSEAKHISRTVESSVLTLVVRAINQGFANSGDTIRIDVNLSTANASTLTVSVNGERRLGDVFTRLSRTLNTRASAEGLNPEIQRAIEQMIESGDLERRGEVDLKTATERARKK